MNAYQQEQLDALMMVREHLVGLPSDEIRELEALIGPYLDFREAVGAFQASHFSQPCTRRCHQSGLATCCSREGIITFFADTLINALVSGDAQIQTLIRVLQQRNQGLKCIYLGPKGCLWQLKPLVCEMFVCEPVKKEVLDNDPDLADTWNAFKKREKNFNWPDKPVLFEMLERYFMAEGYFSSLMYLHTSPGLLRVKKGRVGN